MRNQIIHRRGFGIAVAVILPLLLLVAMWMALPRAGSTAAPAGEWWDTDWQFRRAISITVSDPNPLDTGYTANISVDTATLIADGSMEASGDDLRIVFWDNSNWQELDRRVQNLNTDHTLIWFMTETAIADQDDNYYLYYGNPSAATPPADWAHIYVVGDNFGDGSLSTGLAPSTAGSVTISEAEGRLSISGSTSNTDAGIVSAALPADRGFLVEHQITRTLPVGTGGMHLASIIQNTASPTVTASSQFTPTERVHFVQEDDGRVWMSFVDTIGEIHYWDGSNWQAAIRSAYTGTVDVPYHAEIVSTNSHFYLILANQDGTTLTQTEPMTWTEVMVNGDPLWIVWGEPSIDQDHLNTASDFFLARSYVSPEPVAQAGPEEAAAAIAFSKSPVQESVTPGSTVTYTILLTNTGALTLTDVHVTDPLVSACDRTYANIPPLSGLGYACALTGITADLTNTALITAIGPTGSVISATDWAWVDVTPVITVSKVAIPSVMPEPGGVITFSVWVTSESGEAITLTALSDDIFGDLNGQGTCSAPIPIGIYGTTQCSFTGTVTGNAGDYETNMVTAWVEDNDGNSISASASATVTISDVLPLISVYKTASPATLLEPGGPVTFTVSVTNSSSEAVTLTLLSDDTYDNLNGRGTCSLPQTIDGGVSYSCAFSETINGNAGFSETDTVLAQAIDDDGNTATDSNSATVEIVDVAPTVTVFKTADPDILLEPGGPVTFTLQVTNTSVETVTLSSLIDDIHGDLNGNGSCGVPQSLLLDAGYTCAFTSTVSGNPDDSETDTITVWVQDDDGNLINYEGSATVSIANALPVITMTKTAVPSNLLEPGGPVSFTVEITNSGVEAVMLNSLDDDIHGDLTGQGTCTVPAPVVAGGQYTCVFSSTVTGNAGDSEVDTITAIVEDDETNAAESRASATVVISDALPSITVVKTAEPSSLPEPGGLVTFSVTISNTSVEAVNLDSLIDDVHGDISSQGSCSLPQNIPAGAVYTCSFSANVWANAGESETDTITAQAQDDELNIAVGADGATVNISDVLPTISVSKWATPTILLEPGGPVSFTVSVTNTGVETVTLTSLVDDVHGNLAGQGTCGLPQSLPVGNQYTCVFTSTVTGNAGDREDDTIIAEVQDDDENAISRLASATVFITDTLPSIAVHKTVSPTVITEPGDWVDFSVVITNTGVETVSLISLVDDLHDNLDGQGTCALPQTIPVGAQYGCSFSAMVSGDAGENETDTITASAQDDESNTAIGISSATVVITDALPSILLNKHATPTAVPESGGVVTFSVEISNTSIETVTINSLSDDLHGDVNGQGTCSLPQPISPTAQYTCAFTATISGNAGGNETDTIAAAALDNEGNLASDSDSATVSFDDVLPTILVSKAANLVSLPEPGGEVTFTVAVTNTGLEQVTLYSLADNLFGVLNGQGDCSVPQTIAPSEGYSCSFSAYASGNAGESEMDTVTAQAEDDDGNQTDDTASALVTFTDVLPTISAGKTADPTSVPEPGGLVTFTVGISNTGVETITLISLVDDMHGNLDGQGSCETPQNVSPSDQYICTFSAPVAGNASDSETDTVTALAQDDEGNTTDAVASALVSVSDAIPTIQVTKTAIPSNVPEPGDSAAFLITVLNTSPEPVTLTLLTDDIHGNLNGQGSCLLPQIIDPGAEFDCIFSELINGNAGDSETDTVSAEAQDDEGNTATDSASATVTVSDELPTIAVQKTANPVSVPEPGGLVTFTMQVQNLSVESVTLITLTDTIHGDLDGQGDCDLAQIIASGGTYACSFQALVSGNAGESETDLVVAGVQDDEGNSASDQDSATVVVTGVAPAVTLHKTASPAIVAEPGGLVTFTVQVVNLSGESVTTVSLIDDIHGNLNGQGTCSSGQTIPADSFYECEFPTSIFGNSGDSETDTVTVEVEDDEFSTATDWDTATVTVSDVLPTILATKLVTPESVPEPGGPVTYTVSLTNTGVETVTLVSLIDDVQGNLAGQGTCGTGHSIAPAGNYECHFTASISGNSGYTETNTISATAQDDETNSVLVEANAIVTVTDVMPSVTVIKSVTPSAVPESGGVVTFTAVITNTSVETVTLTALTDNTIGNLNGRGTCSVPQIIPISSAYTCVHSETVVGNSGTSLVNLLTSTVQDDEGNTATGNDSATVIFTDVLPAITVTKSVTPTMVPEPGGPVTFSVTITNTGLETVTLTSLIDNVHGDLNGQGSCSVPHLIPPGGEHRCKFGATVSGDPEDSETDTVTATAQDDESNEVTDSDSATVSIYDVLPAVDVIKTTNPISVPEPGGTVSFIVRTVNLGPEPVTLNSLMDDVHGDLDGQGNCFLPHLIQLGGYFECAFPATVTGNGGESETDTVTATVGDDEGNLLEFFGSATVEVEDLLPTIDVTKSVDPGSVPEPGGQVTFTVDVQNTSIESVTLITLTDNVHGDLDNRGSCILPQILAAGGAYSCTFQAQVNGNASDIEVDTVTAEAQDDDGNIAIGEDNASVVVTGVLPAIAVTKTATPSSVPEPGAAVTFTIQVINLSAETITVVLLEDDIYGDLDGQGTCEVGVQIPSGETYECDFSAEFSGNSGDSETDTISVIAEDDETNEASDQASATVVVTDVLPAITIASLPSPTEIAEPSGLVTFTVLITNTGVETLTLTTLSDEFLGDLHGQGSCSLPQTILPGLDYTCDFPGSVSGNAGQTVTNTVTATAQDDELNTTSVPASATVLVTDLLPSITLLKTAVPTSVPESGAPVTFALTVTNTSVETVTLTSLIDNLHGDLHNQGSCLTPQSIPSGEHYLCSFSATISGNAGTVETDTITASAQDDELNPASDSDSATVSFIDILPAVTLSLTASSSSVPEPGAPVTFTVTITNSAAETVTLTSLVDDLYGNLNGHGSCTVPLIIAPNDQAICSFSTTVSGNADDSVTDTVTASAQDDEGNPTVESDSTTVTVVDVLPSFNVIKTSNPTSVPEPGGSVTFIVQVGNTSPEALTLTSLVDDIYGNLSGQGNCSIPWVIPPGAEDECAFGASVSGNGGESETDTVTAQAIDDENNLAVNSDSATVTIQDVLPTINIIKDTDPNSVPEPGGLVTFTVQVQNPSIESVTLITLTDTVYGDLHEQGTCILPQVIASDGTYSCGFQAEVSGNAGEIETDTITAEAQDDEGNLASDQDNASVVVTGVLPAVSVTKTATPSNIPEPGGLVVFSVRIVNLSGEMVTLVSLVDDIHEDLDGQGDCTLPQAIMAGGYYECEFSALVQGNSEDSETDTITAIVQDDESNSAEDADSATVTVTDAPPVISVTDIASPSAVAEPGGPVTYIVSITNTGVETLTLTTLSDEFLGDLHGQGTCSLPQTILPGLDYTCDFSGSVSGNAGETVTNTVTATAQDDELNTTSVPASATVLVTDLLPSITLLKTAVPTSVPESGAPVTFALTVTNTSVETITLISLIDNLHGDLHNQGSCLTPQSIPSGERYLCSFSATISGNAGTAETDTITASAQDDELNPTSDSDSATVSFIDILPAVTLSLTASSSSVPEPGAPVTFTVTITNSVAETVTLTSLVDDLYGNLNGHGSCTVPLIIAPNDLAICSFSTTVSGNAGDSVTDTVTASAQDDEGNPTVESDSASVTVVDVLPSIDVVKISNPTSVPEPGGLVLFSVRVGNTSPEPLTLISLVDDAYDNLNGQGTCSVPRVIMPGTEAECAFAVIVSGNGGESETDTVTAQAIDDENNLAVNSDSATVTIQDVLPSISVVKTASPTSVAEPGDLVTFTVTVENPSIESVTLTSMVDDEYGNLSGEGDCILPQMISSGGVFSCRFQGEVLGNAGDVITNTVEIVVQDDEGNSTSDADSATVVVTDVLPTISVTKTAEPTSIPLPGGTITFSIQVANNGPEAVILHSLVDNIYGDLSGEGDCAVSQFIAAGDSYNCTFFGQVMGNLGFEETDTVTAGARDDEENQVQDSDSATVLIVDPDLPELAFQKSNGVSMVNAGDLLTYTLAFTNTGGTIAYDIAITDTLPEHTQFIDCHIFNGECELTLDRKVVYTTPLLLPQSTSFASLTVLVDSPLPSQADTINNQANLTARYLADSLTAVDLDPIGTQPDLTISANHTPILFVPGNPMTFTIFYGNQGLIDADNVVITTVLPAGCEFVGSGWETSDGQVFSHTVGSLSASEEGQPLDFVVRYLVNEPQQIVQPEYLNGFTITGHGGQGGDAEPNDNTAYAYVGVPDLAVADFYVSPLPLRPNTEINFTVVLENQGTGWAENPENHGGFWVDIFFAPIVSYPYQRDGELFQAPPHLAAGDEYTVTFTHGGMTEAELASVDGFYVKVDNFYDPENSPDRLYGLVPESNEFNNVGGPASLRPDLPVSLFLPLIIR